MKLLKRILPIVTACVLLFGSCLTVSAAEKKYAYFVEVDTTGDNIIDFKFYSDEPIIVTYSRSYYDLIATGSFRMDKYTNSVNYTTSEHATGSSLLTLNSGNPRPVILNANFDIVYTADNGDETFFFQPVVPLKMWTEPLPMTIQQNLTTILPIAVFCLASLMALIVLRRKLPRFLRV